MISKTSSKIVSYDKSPLELIILSLILVRIIHDNDWQDFIQNSVICDDNQLAIER